MHPRLQSFMCTYLNSSFVGYITFTVDQTNILLFPFSTFSSAARRFQESCENYLKTQALIYFGYIIGTIRVELTTDSYSSHCPADGLTLEIHNKTLFHTLPRVVSVVELLHILLITLRVGAAIPTY